MSWDYRIVKMTIDGENLYQIHEAYYNKNNELCAISKDPMNPHGNTVEELGHDLNMMSQAFNQSALVKGEIVFAKPDWEEE